MPQQQQMRRRRLRRHGSNSHASGWKILIIGIMVILVLVWVNVGMVVLLRQRRDPKNDPAEEAHGLLRSITKRKAPFFDAKKTSTDKIPMTQVLKQTEKILSFPPRYPVVTRSNNVSQESLDMCHRTLWHTLETTTIVLPNNETFIHTGDIDDLWLRDSAAQIHPLLVPFPTSSDSSSWRSLVQDDARLERIVSGLILREAWYIRHDPYANAFRIDDTYVFSEAQKAMGRHDYISTWNYELDSACYYMRMLYYFYKSIPNHWVLREQRVYEAVSIMVDLWIAEQHHEEDAFPKGPLLDCQNCNKPFRYPGLQRNGKGRPTAYTGMTWTGFRPSDDECKYGYLVPANMFAAVVLQYMMEMAANVWQQFPGTPGLIQKMSRLAQDIEAGILTHGIVNHEVHGRIYAYEVDGLGNSLLMDDANVPSLMSIPYLGYAYDKEVYANTRRFILSPDNPTYHKGNNPSTGDVEGYGSPHMNARIRNNIWPMALAVQGLSSDSVQEKLDMVQKLVESTGGTGWMHESFDVENPRMFTRSWFCWADSLFAELVMSLTYSCPSETGPKYKVMSWRDPNNVKGGPYSEA